jgi:hypothetical protein
MPDVCVFFSIIALALAMQILASNFAHCIIQKISVYFRGLTDQRSRGIIFMSIYIIIMFSSVQVHPSQTESISTSDSRSAP